MRRKRINAEKIRAVHAYQFHRMIFHPSNDGNGRRLKDPNKMLIRQINPIIWGINPADSVKKRRYTGVNIPARKIFESGPARAICPSSKTRGSPRNITAPGAAKTKPVVTDKNRENSNAFVFIRNSDHNR